MPQETLPLFDNNDDAENTVDAAPKEAKRGKQVTADDAGESKTTLGTNTDAESTDTIYESSPESWDADNPARLFLLDGMALLYRAHFALIRSPRFTSDGQCTSGIFGMVNFVMDMIRREQPSHMAIVFDTPEPTPRHTAYPEYKAQRDEMPEDLASQLPLVDRLFEALNVTCIRKPGFEADDVIGTMAQQFANSVSDASPHCFAWMVTPDKDYHQLVRDDVAVYKPGRRGSDFEVLGPAEVIEKWEIERVDQVIDILGLMGDTSDNIPGIKGIGQKTAVKLIRQFGSIESLLENTDQLKGKQKERVEHDREMALLSKQLVTIITDVPHEYTLEGLRWKAFNETLLRELFQDLEFETLGKRLFGSKFSSAKSRQSKIRARREAEIQDGLFEEGKVQQEKCINDVPHQYHTITTPEQRADLLKQLLQQKEVCFDAETTGLNARTAVPLGLSFSFTPHQAYYVVCPPRKQEAIEVLREFLPFFRDEKIGKIGHNLKYDLTLLYWNGIDVRGPIFDTMLAHSMKEPEMQHGMDYLAQVYLAYRPIPITDLIGPKGDEQLTLADVPLEKVSQYACEDADVTLQLARLIQPQIEEMGLSSVCFDIECPLLPVLVKMEHEGIRLDVESLADYEKRLEVEIETLRDKIFTAAGHEFNIDSPKQLGVVLYEELVLEENPRKTATGQYSTKESELQRLATTH
ncbi:MAG: DNA polymerase, partial [Planctomycetota bacterium]